MESVDVLNEAFKSALDLEFYLEYVTFRFAHQEISFAPIIA